MKRINVSIALMVLFIISTYGQNEMDALRFSHHFQSGSARYMGLGGAFGALGGDLSTLSSNPAGLGVFRGTEFSFTPSIHTAKAEATHYGKKVEDLKYNFHLGHIGFASAYKTNRTNKDIPGWEYINFGFGVNRIANFHNRILIEGNNHESSLIDEYVFHAMGKMPEDFNPFYEALAWETYLFDPIDTSGNYESVVLGNIRQSKAITTTGGINEMVISLAGNYDDKFYIGGTLGVPFLRYDMQSTYREVNIDTLSDFESYSLNDDISTSGTGINFKLGIIYRPVDFVRIGAAVHTPTFFSLSESYSRKMNSYFQNGSNHSASTPDGKFDYELTTPMRILGSLAFIIGEYGLISADYEFVDYTEARLRSNSYKFFDENDAIQNSFRAQNNIRVGGELRLNPINIRAGYALYGNPYKSGINNTERTALSFGIGLREKNYFFDITYLHSNYNQKYYLYNPALIEPTKQTFTTNTVLMTLGFRL